MRPLIISKLPVTSADAIKTNLQTQIIALDPFKINLSDGEKIGGRTMAEGREGLARLISKIASANINSLAREHNPQDLEDRLAYDAKLEELRQLAIKLNEIVKVRLKTASPLVFDSFEKNSATGSAILVDETSNSTVGAVMLL